MPRKKPFSGKQKKLQLQEKRERKAGSSDHENTRQKWTSSKSSDRKPTKTTRQGKYNPDRFVLNFLKETREEIEKRKLESQSVPITFVSEHELEVDINDVYKPGSVLDMPKRPTWKYTMSKEQLEQKEENYFKDYLDKIHENFGDKTLSYFEHNLETWRQAWRVIEMSDIIVLVTDVRHPVLHFSPALYDHVVHDWKKPLILVLNKIDLVPATVIAAWTSYFTRLFPSLHVVWFTSFPQDSRTVDVEKKVRTKRRRPRKRVYNTQIGPKELLQTCRDICGDKVDFTSWEEKIERDLQMLGCESREPSPSHSPASGDASSTEKGNLEEHFDIAAEVDDAGAKEMKIEDGILTIGFVGHPNVGKSSLMNGLIGKKVVSTSVTPGHTKYFQTYFLTKTVKLCDSPGLVFPSLIAKQLQILSGIYPVAQVQEPYTPVGYLAERIPLVKMLQLQYPKYGIDQPSEDYWTPWDICEAWANKRNYRTAKAARPDVYRAANSILRMAVDGRLCLYMRPPGYTDNKEFWLKHDSTLKLLALQAWNTDPNQDVPVVVASSLPPHFVLEDVLSSTSTSTVDLLDISGDESSQHSTSALSSDDDGDDGSIDDTSKANAQDAVFNKFAVLACEDSD